MNDSISESKSTSRLKDVREPKANAESIFKDEMERFIAELQPQANPQTPEAELNDLTVVEKADDEKRTFYMGYFGRTQLGARAYDFVGPDEKDPVQIMAKPREELLEATTGNTELMPPNLIGRIAQRTLEEGKKPNQPAEDVITFEFWGKIPEHEMNYDIRNFDELKPELRRIFPNIITIRTHGKTKRQATQQVQTALKFVKPYLLQ